MSSRFAALAAALGLLLGCKNNDASRAATAAPDRGSGAQGSAQAAAPGSAAAGSAAAGSGSAVPAAPTPGEVDVSQGSNAKPVIHGEKWNGDEEGGRNFKAYKETWVYVDGVPRGVLLFTELPASMPKAWRDDVEGLDFKPGDPGPHEKKIQILRWRLADYLRLIGIDVAKIKYVYIHGTGVVAIPGEQFRKYAKGITFDFTGNDLTKTRFYWPTTMVTNTRYDRYAAVSVFIEKPPLELDRSNLPHIEGREVVGIPYYGTPARGGFRVYVDYKLAMVIKRNELTKIGRSNPDKLDEEPRWNLGKLLESQGVKAQPVAADLVIARDFMNQKRVRLDEDYVKDLEFESTSQSSGGLLFGKDKLTGTALQLYTKGHVPKVEPLPPLERDWQPGD